MYPKHVPLFRLGLVVGMVGMWLFMISLYWVMTVEVTYGARLVGYAGWGLGGLSAILLVLAMVMKPRLRPVRVDHPYLMSRTSWICLSLAVIGFSGAVLAALQDNLELSSVLAAAAGLLSGYEKSQRRKREKQFALGTKKALKQS